MLSLVASLVALLAALIGTYHTDHLGRRPVLILGTFLCALTLSAAMISSSQSGVSISSVSSSDNVNEAASKAGIAFLILFGAAYAWGYTPLTPIYPGEVLELGQRSTGMGCMVLVGNACSTFTVSVLGGTKEIRLFEPVCDSYR
jgi:MFS family permease